MMKTNSLFLIILLTAFSTLSCSNEEVEPTEEISTDVLIPLSDSYKTLRKRTLYNDGKFDKTFNLEVGVESSIIVDGQRWYGYSKDAVIFVRNKPDGVYILFSPTGKESLFYKYPASNGDSYNTFGFQNSREEGEELNEANISNFEMIAMETDATITQPSTGKIYTGLLHYRKPKTTKSTQGVIFPGDYYIKPGVGLVYSKIYTNDSLTMLYAEEEYLETISN